MTSCLVGFILAFAAQEAVSRDDQTAQSASRDFGWFSKSADIEWVETRSIGSQTIALLATDAHDLVVVDLNRSESDNPRLQFRAGPGLRLAVDARNGVPQAAAAQQRFYCFDRYAVFAIDVGGPAGAREAWRRGDWPAGVAPGADGGSTFQGDPESLAMIVAAASVSDGVIVARNDGRVVLVGAASGEPIWETRTRPLSVVEFSAVGPDEVIMLWKESDDVHVAFVPDRTVAGRLDRLHLGTSWPIWWRAVPGGLVAVWPDEAAFLRSNGDRRAIAPQPALRRFGATLVDLFIPPLQPKREGEWTNDALLVAMDDCGAIAAFSTATGELRWSTATVPLPPPILDFRPRSLHVDGRLLVAVDSRAVAESSIENGAYRRGEASPGPIVAATVLDGDLNYVYLAPQESSSPQQTETLWLRTLGHAASGDEPVSRDRWISGLTTLHAAELRDVQWAGQSVVLISKRRIQAIQLRSLGN